MADTVSGLRDTHGETSGDRKGEGGANNGRYSSCGFRTGQAAQLPFFRNSKSSKQQVSIVNSLAYDIFHYLAYLFEGRPQTRST